MKTFESVYWKKTELTLSGRPKLGQDEYDVFMADDVGLYQDNYKLKDFQTGRVYLSSKRIIFANYNEKRSHIALNLDEIEAIELYNGFLKSSPKVTLRLKDIQNDDLNSCLQKNDYNQDMRNVSWVCPICSYSNNSNLSTIINVETVLPVCSNCGIKSNYEQLKVLTDKFTTTFKEDVDFVSFDHSVCPTCTFANHPSMIKCEICGTKLSGPGDQSSFTDSKPIKTLTLSTSEIFESIRMNIIKLSFHKGGQKKFYQKVQEVLKSFNFTKRSSIKSDLITENENDYKINNNTFSNGIHGLTVESVQKSYQISSLLGQSVQDLDKLMAMAKKLIVLSTKYQGVLGYKIKSTSAFDQNYELLQNSRKSVTKLGQLLHSRQIEKSITNTRTISALNSLKEDNSDLTRSHFSLIYINELARHICDFIEDENILDKNNGLITLYELYFLYNRSRQVNLITTEELFDAISQFDKLNLKVKCEKIEMIQTKETALKDSSVEKHIYVISKKDKGISITARILDYVLKNPGLTILQLQKLQFNMNFIILQTMLNNFVNEGRLSIDKNHVDYTYWPNKILEEVTNVAVVNAEKEKVSIDNLEVANIKLFDGSNINTQSNTFHELEGIF